MPGIATTAARSAVQTANAAGKQLTVVLSNGAQHSGTARWQTPGAPECRTLVLFGATKWPGPYTALPSFGGVSYPDPSPQNPANKGYLSLQPAQVSSSFGESPAAAVYVSLDDVASVSTTAVNSALLLPAVAASGNGGNAAVPAQTNDALTGLGTAVNEFGIRQADPTWPYGTGLE